MLRTFSGVSQPHVVSCRWFARGSPTARGSALRPSAHRAYSPNAEPNRGLKILRRKHTREYNRL
jgi:hypothetical protein